jgi:hypothetical protein
MKIEDLWMSLRSVVSIINIKSKVYLNLTIDIRSAGGGSIHKEVHK